MGKRTDRGMLAKNSVKKPMTVFVCVILVIVLGVVAFTRMTPDLLPKIDLPYVVVVTTYMGAGPEKVESVVTKPVEQASATLDNIEGISSSSSANYSLVILEFNDDADMDASMMNLREKLDQMKSSWPDEVGNPTMLKLNPNMLPVGVAAVSREGYDTIELSDFVTNTLLPRIEGIDGVASVTLSGTVAEEVKVTLNPQKLDALNEKLHEAIDGQFEEADQEIADAEAEIADGEQELADAERKIASGKHKLKQGAAEAEKQFADGRAQLEQGIQACKDGIAQLEQGIAAGEAYNAADHETVKTQRNALAMALSDAEAAEVPDEATIAALSGQLKQLDGILSGLETAKGLHDSLGTLRQQKKDAEQQLASLEKGLQELNAQETETNKKISSAKGALGRGTQAVNDGKEQLEDAKEQLQEGKEKLQEAKDDAHEAAHADEIITLSTVSSILGAQDFAMPAGYAAEGNTDWLVYVGDKFQSKEELENLLLIDLHMDGLEPVYLRDVADITLEDTSEETYARINGENGVLITLSKQSNYETVTASDNIQKTFRQLESEYDGLSFVMLMDQGDYIHLLVDSVLNNLILGAVFAIVILLLFLRDIRPTFIVACSIPISVTFAIVLMYFSGVTLNVISMSGLAVGVGMLVDNSIVVIENIYRLRKNGVSLYRSAVSGAVQVTGAIVASTLTTVCVFVPIVFVQGITRKIFQDMALTIGYSLMASLIVALTLIPAMATGMLRKAPSAKRTFFDRINDGYGKVLSFILKVKAPVILLVVALLGVSAYTCISRGFTYIPSMDTNQISVSIQMDGEEVTLAETAAVADEVYERVASMPGVETVGVMQSSGLAGMVGFSTSASIDNMTMYVVLNENKTDSCDVIANRIEASCADLPATVTASASGMDLSSLSTGGITVTIYGEDMGKMQTVSKEIAELLAGVEGVESASDGLENATPELHITVDKEKAMLEGLTTAQVYMEVSKAMTGTANAAAIEENGDSVVVAKHAGATVEDIRNLVIVGTDSEGKRTETRLADIATFTEGTSMHSIGRSEQRRCHSVTATVADGYNVTLVTDAAEEALKEYRLPEGFRYEFSGERETIMDALDDLLLLLVLGIVIVYLIMVAQFQSLLSPFIVMFTIPLAFTGGLFALNIWGFEISIISIIGFVILVGIIVNNGIVLIDCMNRMRAGGMERREAVIEACKTRIRPVLMTALTTILGLVPLAFGIGMGASLVQPVAVVAIGGLIYATFMTLFVIPVIYDAWCKKAPRVVTEAEVALVAEDSEENAGA